MLPPLCGYQLNGSYGASQKFVVPCLVNPSGAVKAKELRSLLSPEVTPKEGNDRRFLFTLAFFGWENYVQRKKQKGGLGGACTVVLTLQRATEHIRCRTRLAEDMAKQGINCGL